MTEYRFWQLAINHNNRIFAANYRNSLSPFDNRYAYLTDNFFDPLTQRIFGQDKNSLQVSAFDPLIATYDDEVQGKIGIEKYENYQFQTIYELNLRRDVSIDFAPHGLWYYFAGKMLHIFRYAQKLVSFNLKHIYSYSNVIVRLQTTVNKLILRIVANHSHYGDRDNQTIDVIYLDPFNYQILQTEHWVASELKFTGNLPIYKNPLIFNFDYLSRHPYLISADGKYCVNLSALNKQIIYILNLAEMTFQTLNAPSYYINDNPFTYDNRLKICFHDAATIFAFVLIDLEKRFENVQLDNTLPLSVVNIRVEYDLISEAPYCNSICYLYEDVNFKANQIAYINFDLKLMRSLDLSLFYQNIEYKIINYGNWFRIVGKERDEYARFFLFDQFRLELADYYADQESIEIKNRYLLWLSYTRAESNLQALPPEMIDMISQQIK